MNKILKSGEDYLEAIYTLSQQGQRAVLSVEIANHMGVSKPSICRALKNLSLQQCIDKPPYGGVILTVKGLELAKAVQSKHDAVKRLLTEYLGVDAETAEIDACKIEHSLSPQTTQKLFEFLEITDK